MSSPGEAEELVREGEESLEEGEYEDALVAFERALEEDPEHWGAALDRSEALHLLWRTDEALSAVQELQPPADEEDDADRADLEARILEAAGEFTAADVLFEEASRLDTENFPRPVRTTRDDFRAILDDVLRGLPKQIRDVVAQVPVTVEPKPTPEMADQAPHISPEILGLFVGTSIGEKVGAPSGFPDVVLLFQRNLERAGKTRAEVAKEIRITLLHEYGHYLGFEEEDMEGLGLA
ncbi:MAG: metallopeptidase family protein [Candidatus Eisenbacteria bacterium]